MKSFIVAAYAAFAYASAAKQDNDFYNLDAEEPWSANIEP